MEFWVAIAHVVGQHAGGVWSGGIQPVDGDRTGLTHDTDSGSTVACGTNQSVSGIWDRVAVERDGADSSGEDGQYRSGGDHGSDAGCLPFCVHAAEKAVGSKHAGRGRFGGLTAVNRLGRAAGQPGPDDPYFRWALLVEPGALFLFALLFLWQLPHFLAINWMYRDEYLRGGFVMLANEDEHGKTTSTHALGYAVAMVLLMFYPVFQGLVVTAWFLPFALLLSGWLCFLAWRFFQKPERPTARKLFFCTLAYLPGLLLLAALTWR